MFASLHHGVGLSNSEVHTGCVDGALALSHRFVFASQLKVLLEEGDGLLHEAFLVVEETELEGGICLGLSLILGLCNVHELTKVVDGHLHIATFSMHIGEELMCFTLLISGACF